MNGMVPDFIRGIRMVHYQCFRPIICKKLLRLSLETINFHFRSCTTKSEALKLLEIYSIPESRNANEVVVSNLEKLDIDGLNEKNMKFLMKDLCVSGDVESASLSILKNFSKLATVTPEKRVKLTEALLESLRTLKVTITEEHYIGLLEYYSRTKCFPNVKEFLSEMEKDGVKPSEALQQSISKCLSKIGQPQELQEVIRKLKQAGVKINESLHGALIYSYVISGDVNKALQEYDKLKNNDSAGRDLHLYFLKGIIQHGNENLVRDKLADYMVMEYKFSDDEVYSLFETLLINQHLHLIPHVAQAIGEEILLKSLPNLLVKLVHDKNVENAFSLLHSLYNVRNQSGMQNFQLSSHIYKEFLDTLTAVNHPLEDLIVKCGELRKIEECQYVMEYLLYCCLISNKFGQSLEVIYALAEYGAPVEQHYFWPLIVQAYERFQVEGVCHVIETMFRVGIFPTSETLIKYVYPCLDSSFAFKYFRLLSPSGTLFQFYEEVFTKYALERGYYKECERLLRRRPLSRYNSYYFLEKPFLKAFTEGRLCRELIQILKATDGVDPFLVITKLWSEGEVDRLRELLKLFITEEVAGRSKHIAESIINKPNVPDDIRREVGKLLTTNNRYEPDSRSSSREIEKESIYECMEIIEKSEIHIAELEAKSMNTAGQLFRLLKYYMKVGLYNKALKIRKDLLDFVGTKDELSPSYLACFCRLYEYEKNHDEAMRYYRMVREKYPDFVFDVPKTSGLCILFIRTGAFNELNDLLERMPKWWGSLKLVEHKMVNILKGIAALGDPKITKHIFDKMLQKNMIAVTKNTLQVFIDTYLTMGRLDDAVKEFERLICEYGIIPSSMQLLWDTIHQREFQKMEHVLKTVIESSKGNNEVVIATLRMLACLEDVEILRKYFNMYHIPFVDKRFPFVLGWEHFGGEMDLRMKAFKTLILTVRNFESYMHFYARFAVEHVCFERNAAAAVELHDFLQNHRILDKYKKKLMNIIELMKAVERTSNRIVPYAITKNKQTLWRESLL